MIILDVDPNIVRPGLTPLFITLLLAAAMCVLSAWLGWKLHKACDDNPCADTEGLPPTV